jgi:hypothetical protein
VQWGVEESDRRGWPVYIEAMTKGEGLYKKHGLVEVERVDVHLKDWGEEGEWSLFALMLREPKKNETSKEAEDEKVPEI